MGISKLPENKSQSHHTTYNKSRSTFWKINGSENIQEAMGLMFYKKITIHTKYTPDDIRRIFSDAINKPRRNEEVERLLRSDRYVRINFTGNRFQIDLGRNAPRFARSGIHSVLKGKIRQNTNTQETAISMIVRPNDEYVLSLGLVVVFISAVLVYSIINHLTSPLIISSILLFLGYTLFFIDFNSHVKSFKRIIDNCFNW
jgi:hypothetical protein